MCFLGDEILGIEKNFSFKFFQRLRYYFLFDPSYSPIFRKYFSETQLLLFKREWVIYNLLVNVIRKEEDSLPHVRLFVDQIKQIYDADGELEGGFFIKVLAGFYLIKFTPENSDKVRMVLLEFISASKKKITAQNQSHFALLLSNLSNLFFKNKMRKDSLQLKKESLEIARRKKSDNARPEEPDSVYEPS